MYYFINMNNSIIDYGYINHDGTICGLYSDSLNALEKEHEFDNDWYELKNMNLEFRLPWREYSGFIRNLSLAG